MMAIYFISSALQLAFNLLSLYMLLSFFIWFYSHVLTTQKFNLHTSLICLRHLINFCSIVSDKFYKFYAVTLSLLLNLEQIDRVTN
jgi:hypothetical protein